MKKLKKRDEDFYRGIALRLKQVREILELSTNQMEYY